MLVAVYVTCCCVLFTQANKIGLLDRSHEDRTTTSSLKTEIGKYKSAECGPSSSSEESYEKTSKKAKNQRDSDESESSESEDDRKKRRRGNNSPRNKYNHRRNSRNDDDSNSREYESRGENYGQVSPGGYPSQRPGHNPYQQPPYQDPYSPRNSQYPGRPNSGQYPPRGGLPYPALEHDPYQRPGGGRPYGGRPEVSYPDRGTGSYGGRYPYQSGQDSFQNHQGMYSGHREPYQNREGSREAGRGSARGGGHSNKASHRGSKRKSGRKPAKSDSEEDECTSQCVFTNMDIMEDDGIPSESAMIKWAQENIKNDKLKSSAVKEIRKCFGTLASSDGDNSCEFSKSLASCLKLNLDEN